MEKDLVGYNNYLKDLLIKTANNTDNLIVLINELIFTIKKKYEYIHSENNLYYKRNLFNTIEFRQIEKIFFQYFMSVSDNFFITIREDLTSYLLQKHIIVFILLIIFALSTTIYCLITRISLIKKIIDNLKISRCIMKIIPTSVIINTPELETWIENKY